jgi:hypothetical protein
LDAAVLEFGGLPAQLDAHFGRGRRVEVEAPSCALAVELHAAEQSAVVGEMAAMNTVYPSVLAELDEGRTLEAVKLALDMGADVNATNKGGNTNALNASQILSVNNAYGPAWRTPSQILAGRLLKCRMQATF